MGCHVLDGSAEAIEFEVKEDFSRLGIPLKDMNLKKNILVAGIIRGSKPIIPSGGESIQPGDRVVVISSGTRLRDISDITEDE